MRIATRLWLSLVFVNLVVLGVGVSARVAEEQKILLDVTLRDREFFGYALHAAIAREHRGDPLADARAMLDEREVAAAHIAVRLVSTTSAGGLPRPRIPPDTVGRLGRGEVVVEVRGTEIVTYVPVETNGSVAIELSEPRAIESLLRTVGWKSLVTQTVALGVVSGLVTFVLIGWLVGRPIGRLATLARRIGSGDLDARADLPENEPDEVAILAHEMNDMADRLRATRRALDESDTERADALERLRHADRLRTVGQLASSLAHELGTPLNVISGHARIIGDEPENLAEVRASSRVILEQTHRMTQIVRGLLDFARRRNRSIESHEVVAIVERAVETMQPLARRHRATLHIAPMSRRVTVRADAQQIFQVLTNLFTNAMQAMPNGGEVRIAIDDVEREPPVGVHAKAGRFARISVSDSGSGIEPGDLPHLFEPFFTRKAEGEGTGLGLAVVEGIVKEHHGFLEVESIKGVGTTFRVFLPIDRVG